MDVFLWVLQILLGLMFLVGGLVKAFAPKERLQPRTPYVEDFTQSQVRMIGAVEALGGLGVILPWATGIAPVLTPIAALGLAVTMAVAARVHVRRKEPFTVNLVIAAVAIVIAIGRF
ncbi:DoxX family protein [Nonomuraea sp. NPDC050328]|uniref:DoxX family protein n=1 Tax=Nonomuraea sp. NPDC050328 TaxID=3364361 RepID=UPI0037AD6AE7